jgi:hypothetical protein
MIISNKISERGQALVLLVMAIVGLLGFTALAIDGGMVYSDRRIAQNAADAAALAGTGKAGNIFRGQTYSEWSCPKTEAETAAVLSAQSNDFAITPVTDVSSPTETNGVTAYCNDAGHYLDVHVKISHQTQTAFAHFVFNGDLENTVDAVARVYAQMPAGGFNAILAEDDECDKDPIEGGLEIVGSSQINVDGGSIHSNCDLTIQGSPTNMDVNVTNGGEVHFNGDNGDYKHNNVDVSPPAYDSGENTYVNIDPPPCDAVPNYGTNVQGTISETVIGPGVYNNIDVTGKDDKLKLQSGLYCIEGSFKATGGIITGTEVTLYFPSTAGDFDTEGNAIVKLSSPQPPGCEDPPDPNNPSIPGPCFPAIGGMLIYYEPGGDNKHIVQLGGTSGSYYAGMVYAPNSTVKLNGTTNMEDNETIDYGISIVAFHVFVNGTTDINITYDAEKMPLEDAWITLLQ